MARTQTTKAKAVSHRKRVTPRRKAAKRPSQNSWQVGAGIFALAAVLGAGAYMLSINLEKRTSVAELVEHFEVPGTAKERNPSVANPDSQPGAIESAPTR
jgi:hypothetical protein